MAPHVPPELTDRIIDSIPIDRQCEHYQTLLNCALVSQDWLPASRCRLFTCVDISTRGGHESFVANVLRSPRLEPYLKRTKQVVLTNESVCGFIYGSAGHLPSLESLTIQDVNWKSHPPHPRIHLTISRFSTLRKLVLFQCQLPSIQMLRRMVSALSTSLRNLHLDNVTWPPVHHGSVPVLQVGPALDTLRISYFGDDKGRLAPFLAWLSHTSTATGGSLRVFSLRRTLLLDNHACMAFLQLVAPGLVQLSINIAYTQLRAVFQDLRSLQNLSLMIPGPSWRTVSSLLLALPFESRIRRLRFEVRILLASQLPSDPASHRDPDHHPPAAIDDHELDLVDSALQGDRFENLKHVEFAVWQPVFLSRLEAADLEAEIFAGVQRKLPRLAERGIIFVRYEGFLKGEVSTHDETMSEFEVDVGDL